MRRIALVLAASGLGIAALTIVLGLVFRPTVSSHARAAAVLAHTLDLPGAEWIVARVTRDPRLEERTIEGVPTTVAHPGHARPGPTLVFLNGATPRGRHHPSVRRLAKSLARFGMTVYVPDVHGLAHGEITEPTVAGGIAVARVAAKESSAGTTALAGVSVGTTLALLAAAHSDLAGRVRVVAGLAPYADLVEVIRLATTGWYRSGGRLRPYSPDPFVGLVVARSLFAGMAAGEARDEMLERLRSVHSSEPEPLAVLRRADRDGLPEDLLAVVELLSNRDAGRFDELYENLPLGLRERAERLSPIRSAAGIEAPVELASGPRDKYFPLSESRELVAAVPDGRLTVTRMLGHTGPRIWRFDVVGIARFYGFLVRALDAAAG